MSVTQQNTLESNTASSGLEQINSEISRTIIKLRQTYPQAIIKQRVDRLGVSLMLKLNLELHGNSIMEQAQAFIDQHQTLWGHTQLSISKVEARKDQHVVHIKGAIEGRTILNQDSKFLIKSGRLEHVNNGIGALNTLIKAQISEEQAIKSTNKLVSQKGLKIIKVTRGAVSYEPGVAHEVFEFRAIQSEQLRSWIILVDGRDGAIISVKSGEQK